MVEFFLGAAGMLLVAAAFIAGIFTGMHVKSKPEPAVHFSDEDSSVSPEQIRLERRQLKEDNDAFRTMQKYNAGMAYRMNEHEGGDLR